MFSKDRIKEAINFLDLGNPINERFCSHICNYMTNYNKSDRILDLIRDLYTDGKKSLSYRMSFALEDIKNAKTIVKYEFLKYDDILKLDVAMNRICSIEMYPDEYQTLRHTFLFLIIMNDENIESISEMFSYIEFSSFLKSIGIDAESDIKYYSRIMGNLCSDEE